MTSHYHDDRKPDSLVTTGPERSHPSTSGHTPIPPPSAPIASSTLLEPHPLASLEVTTSDQSTLHFGHMAKQTLLSQQNDVVPKAPTDLGSGVSVHSESKPSDEEEPVKVKDNVLKQVLTERETIMIGERTSRTTMNKDDVIQTPTVDEGGGKTGLLSSSKEEVGESGALTSGGHSERGVELPCPHSTDPEQLLEELGLSTLSPSPSPSHSVDLSPTISSTLR